MEPWLAGLAASPRLQAAREALARGQCAELSGLEGTARLVVALLACDGPLLVAVPRERDVEPVAADLQTLAALAGREGHVLPLPSPGPLPYRNLARHAEAGLRRATALHTAARGRVAALVASPAGLLRRCLAPRYFDTRVVALAVRDELTPEILLEALDESGYRREDPVTIPGQVARRGGIVDFYPPDHEAPVRVEFLGDTIESLRRFDPDTQRSTAALPGLEILPLSDLFLTRSLTAELARTLPDLLPAEAGAAALAGKLARGLELEVAVELVPLLPGATVAPWHYGGPWTPVVVEPEAIRHEAEAFAARAHDEYLQRRTAVAAPPEALLATAESLHELLSTGPALHLRELDPEARTPRWPSRPVTRYAGDLRRLTADLRDAPGTTVALLGSAGRSERLLEVLRDEGLAVGETVLTTVGALSRGFELPDEGLRLLADGDVFPEEVHLHRRRGRGAATFLSDFRDLRVGDLVVHEDHGIGRFEGLQTIEVGGQSREFMVLSYQGGDKLKVPVETFDRVQKYRAGEAARPAVDKLGSGHWEKVRKRVKKAMRDMAAELLRLYAERKARPGHAFTAQSPWQREFDETFEYDETPDQAAAIADVARDMATPTPMDRLICGDVGYGKTEVAMRAAMRCVLEGRQVAVLAPTTVLAFQHWKTFRRRFAPFPVAVEMVSRFRAAKDVKAVLAATAAGKVDILIGTHRLLSKDVVFRDPGLLVVDEEQRFGVAAKERLKQVRTTIDSLTLSATPIPRTLQMGLSGLRDMSVIETPPRDRIAIQTSVVKFSTDVIAAAVRQELAREGQVYVVHNRVESIWSFASLIQRLVPEARVVVGHGQMPEAELEKTMLAFVEGRADVLVATTIIENGLDIPRANTLIVNRADRYGLAQLYQLRGRVGRSDRPAYAFLLVPPDQVLSEIARKRLAAIREFSDLGAGFRIAALDLELRGAGNLLGGEQSGHILAVGLDMYVKLLTQAMAELSGEPSHDALRVQMNLRLDLRVPPAYVGDEQQRMAVYKDASRARDLASVANLRQALRDRYGAPPPEVDALLHYAAARIRAEALGIEQVDLGAAALHVRFGPAPPLPPAALVTVAKGLPGATLSPQGVLRVPAGVAPIAALEGVLSALEHAAGRSVGPGL